MGLYQRRIHCQTKNKDNNDLREYFDRWKNAAKKKKQNDLDIAKGVEKLEYLMNVKPKKDAYDILRKNAGMSEGFRVLDKLFNKKKNDLKKDALKEIQQNSDKIKGNRRFRQIIKSKIAKKIPR